jgi:hypothetical protein
VLDPAKSNVLGEISATGKASDEQQNDVDHWPHYRLLIAHLGNDVNDLECEENG